MNKVKTLGARRVWSTGLRPSNLIFKKVEQINIVPDENEEEVKMVVKEDTNDYTGVEPLVLWESTDTENPPPPIVVEMFLCKWLRPHQRDGVRFMAECVTGQRDFEGNGRIFKFDYLICRRYFSR